MSLLRIDALNACSKEEFVAALAGVYEHSPWVGERAWSLRPFASLAQLKLGLARCVAAASRQEQLALVRCHPELAGKAAVAGELTAESSSEQGRAGLSHCTPEEFALLRRLNAGYAERFGWPFVVAVRGPRGDALSRTQILQALQRRVDHPPDWEFAETLRQIHRIAELRLNDRFGYRPLLGERVYDWCAGLAAHSEEPWASRGELTATYLSDAHRACAADIEAWMRDCGLDEVGIDAVGNVVGRYRGSDADRPWLLTGSHYDTVRNAGRYDGRVGIFVPMACVRSLHAAGRRMPFGIEVVAFAEEEGQRYAATFLGSGALVGEFDPRWLEQVDSDGVRMDEAMRRAGLPANREAIASLRRDPAQYQGFVEVHIEQGPVLDSLDLPLGVVTSINASVRCQVEIVGFASHAGTTPMHARRDAVVAAAEWIACVEQLAAGEQDAVATVGRIEVPGGSVNVVPGRCQLSLDVRAPSDEQRDRLLAGLRAELQAICSRRGLGHSVTETMREQAAPSDPRLRDRWERAVTLLGLPVHRMPSGAGHDAMKMHRLFAQAMLFVRGANAGVSHNPLESSTSDDLQLACDAFLALLEDLAASC